MDYFKEKKIQAIFWSAIENPKPMKIDEEEGEEKEEEASTSEDSESESASTMTMEQDSEALTTSSDLLIRNSATLIERLKGIGLVKGVPGEKKWNLNFEEGGMNV